MYKNKSGKTQLMVTVRPDVALALRTYILQEFGSSYPTGEVVEEFIIRGLKRAGVNVKNLEKAVEDAEQSPKFPGKVARWRRGLPSELPKSI